MNHNNIKLLFLIRTDENNEEYIFLISEDKCQYTIASYILRHTIYLVYNITKITQELEYINQDFLLIKELNDIIKESKNIKEYKFVNLVGNINTIMKYIRKLKIKNIL